MWPVLLAIPAALVAGGLMRKRLKTRSRQTAQEEVGLRPDTDEPPARFTGPRADNTSVRSTAAGGPRTPMQGEH